MKKSNILVMLIGLSVVLFIAITCIVSKKMTDSKKKDFLEKEIELPDFSVIVGEPNSWFELRSGDSNCIIVKHDGKVEISTDFFKVNSDTLYFSKRDKPYNKMKYIVQCKSLKKINIMKKSICFVAGFKAKCLNVNINDGQLIFGEDPVHKTGKDYWLEVEQLNVSANKGVLLFKNTIITYANIRLNNARGILNIKNNIVNLDLQLTDSSNIHSTNASNSGNIRNTNIKADATSKIDIVKR